MKNFVVLLLLLSFESYACKPTNNFISPTLENNFKNSDLVFKGKIIKILDMGRSSKPFGNKYRISFEVVKNIKGAKEKMIHLYTFSNSCDTFGQSAILESECIIFANEGVILSGVFSGEASECGDIKIINQRINSLELRK